MNFRSRRSCRALCRRFGCRSGLLGNPGRGKYRHATISPQQACPTEVRHSADYNYIFPIETHLSARKPSVSSAFVNWWREQPDNAGLWLRLERLGGIAREFVHDSLPDRRRERFGDADYDWDYRVDTTSANVGWHARLMGFFSSSYQPIEAEIFREMMNTLAIDFGQFTFVDIGSGKGRALLLASEYPFRRIIGVELLPELNRIAQENIRAFSKARGHEIPAESISGDATGFDFPAEPLVVYFFHPLTEAGFRQVMANLKASLAAQPRPIHIIYANPIFELIVAADKRFRKACGTHQYAIYEMLPNVG